MPKLVISRVLQGIIWVGFAVILLSPLYISSALFFPFIVTKTVAFMIAVEIMFVAYLLLAVVDSKYKVRFNLVLLLMLIYIGVLTLASALGNDFYKSFWSNNERSDGILLLIHLFLLVFVLTGFLRKVKNWLYVFDIFLISTFCVSLVALDQFFGWNHFIASSNGARLAATIGNAGYVGGYMIFGVFMALFMLFKRKNVWLKTAYGVVALLEIFIAVQTQTRGAMLALLIGGLIFIFYLLFFYFSDSKQKVFNGKNLKIFGIVLIILIVLGIGSVFTFKNSHFIKSNPILDRIASVSLQEQTANNRLVTWGIAWKGFLQKPILGYGQENFYQVFDKYYSSKNSEQWFDRSHSMIFDRLITGGAIGLVAYLAFLLVPFYFLWKFYKKSDSDEATEDKSKIWGKKYFVPVVFTILILAYVIQNLFIFEALVTYVPLMLVLAFVGMYGPSYDLKFLENQKFKTTIFVIFIILLLPAMYAFNIKPLNANRDFIKVMAARNLSLEQTMSGYEDVLSRNTLGNQEYRKYYFDFFINALSQWMGDTNAQKQMPASAMVKLVNGAEKQMENQLAENNHSTANYLMAMRFYDAISAFDSSNINKSIEAFNRAKDLSPDRPVVYYTGSNAYFYLSGFYDYQKNTKDADIAIETALNTIYEGVNKNYYKSSAVMDFVPTLYSLTGNQRVMGVLVNNGIAGKNVTDMMQELVLWFGGSSYGADQKAELKNQLSEILNSMIKNDAADSAKLTTILNSLNNI